VHWTASDRPIVDRAMPLPVYRGRPGSASDAELRTPREGISLMGLESNQGEAVTRTPTTPTLESITPRSTALKDIRNKIVSGLIVSLPIVITFWIFYWLYQTLSTILLNPAAALFQRVFSREALGALPPWWEKFFAPLLAVLLALTILYILGYFARSRAFQLLDWLLQRVPVVTMVYKAVRNVFQSLESQRHGAGYQRVVLVPFPHPGSRALAFVTKSLRDERTGQIIVCVCVLTGVFPPAGFTFFLPETDVVETSVTVNEALQTILSGGISAPDTIPYHPADPGPAAHARTIAAP
jgi:uncharacterized membrane protein